MSKARLYPAAMRDRVFLPLVALAALALIALSLVWPQGQGAPSPPPFGHPLAPIKEKPTMKANPAIAAPGRL
jgi:hypothetical protein